MADDLVVSIRNLLLKIALLVSLLGFSLVLAVVILSFSFFIPPLYSVTPWVLVILWEKC